MASKLGLTRTYEVTKSFPWLPRLASTRAGEKIPETKYPFVIIGGGSGGCTMAAKLTRGFRAKNSVAVIEPAERHYYQPLWTMVGAGLKTLSDTYKPMGSVLPKSADWIKDRVESVDPHRNTIITSSGREIGYDFLIVASGLQLNYERIKGLPEAFEVPGIGSNYSSDFVDKTHAAIRDISTSGGTALFTFPNTPIKCPGAPQKIMYLAEAEFRKRGIRDKVKVLYNTSLPVIFGVKKYANALHEFVVSKRDINVNYRHNLIEVKPDSKEAVFELLDQPGESVTFPFEMLHVVPPMSPPVFLKSCPELVNEGGFVKVNKENLQHVVFPNVFAIGDCSSLPTSKTAAAIAGQSAVLYRTIKEVIKGEKPSRVYDGYTSCPLLTGDGKCILAEFDYNGEPLETFPVNQGKERFTMYHMKRDAIPFMYWNFMLRGYWNGPKYVRKLLHLGMSK